MIRSSHDNFYVLKYFKIEQQNFEKRFHLTSIANEPHFSFKYQSHFDTGKNDIIMKIYLVALLRTRVTCHLKLCALPVEKV